MKTIWNMISRPGQHHSSKAFPEVEDDEMLFSKNNVCVHPCTAGSVAPRHSLGYLTVTAAPDPVLGHTLLLSWRPNQLMVGTGRRGQRSLSETQPRTGQHFAAGDFAQGRSRPADVSRGTSDVTHPDCDFTQPHYDGIRTDCDVTQPNCDVTLRDCDVAQTGRDVTQPNCDVTQQSCDVVRICNGLAEETCKDTADGEARLGARLEPPPALASCRDRAQDQEVSRRLSTQSAPPSPRLRSPASEAPGLFTVDLGQARSVRVFLTPDDPGCGQLVLCSRQSQYRILHFHCGGLDRLARLFDGWRHLRAAAEGSEDGGCRLFAVCSPVVTDGEDHPEEDHHHRLTPDLWHEVVTPDGRLTDPDRITQVVFFGGLEPSLRRVVWPLLLGVLSWSDSAEQREERRSTLEQEFERICALPGQLSPAERAEFQRQVVSTVDKDVVRTDPANPFFCGRANPNVQTLRRILLGFAAANPSLGYTQGMSDLLAPLLLTLGSASDAYWALDALIKRSEAVVCPRDDVMDVQLGYLRELLRLLTPDFYNHLASVEDGLELLFAHRWLLLCFKREFPEPAALRIWETCWSCRQTRHFSLFVCVAVCAAYAADVVDSAMNADGILLHFTSLSQHMDSEVVLRKARGLLHRFLSLASVPCSLAPLCGGGREGTAGPWAGRRVAPVVCYGHDDGAQCPAAR